MGGEADSEDDLRRMVRTHHKHGADLIKVMSTGGFMTHRIGSLVRPVHHARSWP